MKIALISTPMEKTPPEKYGGTEQIVSLLTEELVKRGHQVTLFATGDSQTKAELISAWPHGVFHDRELNMEVAHHLLFLKFLEFQDKFDIIHNHNGWRFLPYLKMCNKPVVITYHSFYFPTVIPLFNKFHNAYYTSLSLSHQKPVTDLNFIGNVYNGIDLTNFEFSEKKGNYFCFLGRIDPQKGIKEAIQVAQKAKVKLLIAARIDEKYQEYFVREIKPLLNDEIVYIGEVGGRAKTDFLKNATAILFPINWEEPFGLVMIEAMACGTPVLAFDRGSVPEVVKDGQTGYISPQNDIDKMVKNVQRIICMLDSKYKNMRQNARKNVEENFIASKMVDGYEKVYEKVIENYQRSKK